jgi:hypothetical protein
MQASQLTIAPPKPIDVIFPTREPQGRYDALSQAVLSHYAEHDHAACLQAMIDLLRAIEADSRGPSPRVRAEITQAIHAFLGVFCRPDFVVPESAAPAILWFNPTIANAMAASGDNTTDAYCASLEGQRQQVFKSAVIMSPRNFGQFRLDELFDVSPTLASSWVCQTFKTAFAGNVHPRTRQNLIDICRTVDSRFVDVKDVQEPYFLSTYLGDPDAERAIKSAINAAIQRNVPPIDNGPPKRRVAVVSDFWYPGHSVHRTLSAYVEAIRPDFELILIHAIRESNDLDQGMFDRVIKLAYDGQRLETAPLHGLGLDAIIYPDIGMTGYSIVMSNMRIAPVQIMMTGHPVSTFGSEIDYFISGELVENEEHQANYSERLVRLPGFGATHALPTYEPKGTPKDYDGVLINASWYGQKVVPEMLRMLDTAARDSGKRVKLQIFAGGAATNRCGFGAYLDAVGAAMSSCEVVVYPHLDYPHYMAQLERGDFAVDCTPFAGSNTVSDNLWLRKPVVALEGDRWFNRIGPAMLRAVGLDALVATNPHEFVGLITDMIRHGHVREAFADQLAAVDLGERLYAPVGADAFREWVSRAVS